eukprot:16115-Eustigmatos_ZCMA.PRE.1
MGVVGKQEEAMMVVTVTGLAAEGLCVSHTLRWGGDGQQIQRAMVRINSVYAATAHYLATGMMQQRRPCQ